MEPKNHKHYEDLLHAYELDMLDPDTRAEFELHLMECEDCFQKVSQFQEPVELLRHDLEIKQVMRRAAEEPKPKPLSHRPLWRRLIPTGITILILAILLVLKPWEIRFNAGQEAKAYRPKIMVSDFTNIANPLDTRHNGMILTGLLSTDLAESEFISVISRQRIYEVSRRLDLPDTNIFDTKVILNLAHAVNANWILSGRIFREQPTFIIEAQLIDVSTGDILASREIHGQPADDIFAVADSLSAEIKKFMTLPPAALSEDNRFVGDFTTHSTEAYRLFLQGEEFLYRSRVLEAEDCFNRALLFDSTLAVAYYHLAGIIGGQYGIQMIDKASAYFDKTSRRYRYLIRSRASIMRGNLAESISELQNLLAIYPDDRDALLQLGNNNYSLNRFGEAVTYYLKVLETDSENSRALGNLAYSHAELGDFEMAITAANEYIRHFPNDANPYSCLGDIYLKFGKIDEAMAAFKKSLEITPGFFSTLYKLGNIHLVRGEYTQAEENYRRLADDTNNISRTSGQVYLAYIPIYRGELTEALTRLEEIGRDRQKNPIPGILDYTVLQRAIIYHELKQIGEAIQLIERYRNQDNLPTPRVAVWPDFYIQLLAESGQIEKAQRELDNLLNEGRQLRQLPYLAAYAKGVINLAKGDRESAISDFRRAAEEADDFAAYYMLGLGYFNDGRYIEAINALEKKLNGFASMKVFRGVWVVKAHYYLGVAYEQLNTPDKAIEYYEKFITFWGHRNPPSELVQDARIRLVRLRQSVR